MDTEAERQRNARQKTKRQEASYSAAHAVCLYGVACIACVVQRVWCCVCGAYVVQ